MKTVFTPVKSSFSQGLYSDYFHLLKAIEDGNIIQMKHRDTWIDMTDVSFLEPAYEFRIKKTPNVFRFIGRAYAKKNREEVLHHEFFLTEVEDSKPYDIELKMTEVIE